MREIKFRAWDKVSKNMFYDVSTEEFIIWDEGKTAYKKDCDFMQYIGLKDKKGEEIYEGDILEEQVDHLHDYQGRERFFTVFWDEQKAAFKLEGRKIYSADYATYLVKVGNKYENPDLLERIENGTNQKTS